MKLTSGRPCRRETHVPDFIGGARPANLRTAFKSDSPPLRAPLSDACTRWSSRNWRPGKGESWVVGRSRRGRVAGFWPLVGGRWCVGSGQGRGGGWVREGRRLGSNRSVCRQLRTGG